MKFTLLFIAFLCITKLSPGQATNPNLDTTLAKSFGADDYGMKKYFFVILKTGSNTTTDKEKTDSLFAGHMQNISRLAELDKLIVAGPFLKNNNGFRGIFILDAASTEEVNKLLESDPAINEKLLEPEIYPWYGSAALPAYLEVHEKIWKTGF